MNDICKRALAPTLPGILGIAFMLMDSLDENGNPTEETSKIIGWMASAGCTTKEAQAAAGRMAEVMASI